MKKAMLLLVLASLIGLSHAEETCVVKNVRLPVVEVNDLHEEFLPADHPLRQQLTQGGLKLVGQWRATQAGTELTKRLGSKSERQPHVQSRR